MPASLKDHTRVEFLDGMRGVAILWILLFHIMANHLYIYGNLIGSVIAFGHYGVQIFLIISGFGITKSIGHLHARKASIESFIARRLKRIYIPYFFCLLYTFLLIPLVTYLLAGLKSVQLHYQLPDYGWGQWISLITLTKVFTPGLWSLATVYEQHNTPLWYMSVLVQIYVVVGAALLCKQYYAHVIIVITLLSIVSFFPTPLALMPRGFFLPYWPSFVLGILLFYLWHNYEKIVERRQLIIGCSIFGLLMLSGMAYTFQSLPFSNFVFSLFCGFIILMLRPYHQQISNSRFFRPFIFIGSFAYSIYLIHDPLYHAIDVLLRIFFPLMSMRIAILSTFFMVTALSYPWYLYYEKPFNKSSKKK